jgi:hypothetical protein
MGYYLLHTFLNISKIQITCVTLMDERFRHLFVLLLYLTTVSQKRPLGRPRRRWVDNIRMDLGEVGWRDVDWIGLAQDRNRWIALVNSVLTLRVP